MREMKTKRKGGGMNVGSASLVMVFSVLCLTIFAVLSVITARSEWNLAQKTADAVTAYYEADYIAVTLLDQITDTYDGAFVLPEGYLAQIEETEGRTYLNYYVDIDSNQMLWVQLYHSSEGIQVARWEVVESGVWIADQTLNVWGG